MKEIYLDNAATSYPKAPGVGEAMHRYIDEVGANISRGCYRRAMDAALVVLETREQLARLFSFSGSPNQVIFTPGVTYGLNLVLRGYLNPGDHVLVSSMEHNAVMRPLQELSQAGINFTRIPADRNGETDPAEVSFLLRSTTRLVMASHASNVSGSLFPLTEVSAICRQRGIPLVVDAAQTAGHCPLDWQELGLSALCVPGHKGLLGPQGIGAVLLDESFTKQLRPLVSGGTGSSSEQELQPDFLPDLFESGTLNLPGIFGLNTAVSFVLEQGVERLRQHEAVLTQRLLTGLAGLPLRVVGPADPGKQTGVISLDFPGRDNAEVALRLEQDFAIYSRCGLHCAPNAHKTLGTFPQGTVRLSVGYTTTDEEIDATIAAIKAITEE